MGKERPGDTYDFRVVIFKTLVGIRTGPLTRISLSLARVIKSPQTTQGISHCTPSKRQA